MAAKITRSKTGKEFLREQASEFTRDLLNNDRKTVEMIVAKLPDQYGLNRYML